MSFTPDFRERIEALLSAVVPIRTKAMFGGVGIYSGDFFFAIIAEDKLYFKVGDLNRTDYEMAGMEPFYPYNSPTPMGYWELPVKVLQDPTELLVWVEKAIVVASKAKTKKRNL